MPEQAHDHPSGFRPVTGGDPKKNRIVGAPTGGSEPVKNVINVAPAPPKKKGNRRRGTPDAG